MEPADKPGLEENPAENRFRVGLASIAMSKRFRRTALLVALVLSGSLLTPVTTLAVTQAEVDEACAEYRDAKEILDAAIAERDQAQAHVAELYGEREEISDRVTRLSDQIAERYEELEGLRQAVIDWAVESYMAAEIEIGGLVLQAGSLEDLVTGQEFVNAVTTERIASVDRWRLILSETETMEQQLNRQKADLLLLEIQADQQALTLAAATDEVLFGTRQLKGECNRLYRQRQDELARARALEAARRGGTAAGVGPDVTPGFVCPMDPAATSFINDWGFPRSGGRTHRGNDLFAPRGQPVYAVADGVVTLVQGGLGGIGVWLSSNYGVDFYYAHFQGYASGLSSGTRVSKGQLIGYNGNTGNARTTPPHVHFQLHPGGRTSQPFNPYPTLVRACL